MAEHSDPRRYFDNAATSFPKPPGVAEAMRAYMADIGASAGRGAYREALESRRVLDDCRDAVRTLFHMSPADHVIFTLNGTDGLNMALKGMVRAGDHVVTTAMDHNSVLRPLHTLRDTRQIEFDVVAVDPQTTRVSPDDIAAAIRPETRLVALNHASNVTGVLQPLESIAALCVERGVALLVDAAQSAGHVPIDWSATPIDLLACPGHKGLLGPLGTGVLLIRSGVEERLTTLREGGTGSESESAEQPRALPDRFEVGSHNAVGIAGLHAGVRWLIDNDLALLRKHELALCRRMITGMDELDGLRFFGPHAADERVGVFSVVLDGFEPTELAALLEQEFELLTRSGLHCAPFAHRTIGTEATGGTTRLSFGPFMELADIDAALAALKEVTQGAEDILVD